ncbi:hypothetical protein BDW72DRAFT_44169 [Aspergillus terricola var. indicus]
MVTLAWKSCHLFASPSLLRFSSHFILFSLRSDSMGLWAPDSAFLFWDCCIFIGSLLLCLMSLDTSEAANDFMWVHYVVWLLSTVPYPSLVILFPPFLRFFWRAFL